MDRGPDLSRLIGRRLGVYHVVARLGAGGMGEVYRARDTRLGRDVALKVLPHAFTEDPDRLARFEREARTLAALNHSNIAAIYGIDDAKLDEDSSRTVRALVLELVEGETLAERIHASLRGTRTGLPLSDALAIAGQIADALDAAHEKGIVHRDLKPANIKITPDGIVKVLDFGLAKLAARDDANAPSTGASSTLTAANTRAGVIVGTPAYMSPEQARGLAVDKRTDVWAFGCVLYEMLTGRRAFAGETPTDTLAAVLEREPDATILPENTPAGVRRVLLRCLEKNPKRRLRDVADVRHELEDAAAETVSSATRDRKAPRFQKWAVIGACIAVTASAGIAGWAVWRGAGTETTAGVTRTAIVLPQATELDTRGGAGPLAISPDGRRVAYALFGDGRTELYVRSLDEFESRPIAGTNGAQYPFFSPDGEWVAFFADNKLKKVAIRGGSPLTICDAPTVGVGGSRGGTWAPDGTIVFDPGRSGLLRVDADGGPPEPITSQDAEMDKQDLSWPHFLPGGRALIVTTGTPGSVTAQLAVLSMSEGRWWRLGPGSQGQYLPSGHIVYHAVNVREGELHALAFDVQSLESRGMPASVLENVFRAADGGAAYFAIAQNGTLIYTRGGYERTLVRSDRNGRRTPLTDDRRGFRHPQISPDGSKVAVTIDPRPSQVWVYDLNRRTSTPLSTERHNLSPLWAPDGRRVTYSSGGDMYWRAADASTTPELLLKRELAQYATSWSPDGRVLFFEHNNVGDRYDIWLLPLSEEPRPLIATAANESSIRPSPDGRWVAYVSDESGRDEVYVRRYPNVDNGKWTVSTNGGAHPGWSRDGSELFYSLGPSLYRVPIDTRGDTFTSGAPELLFSGPFDLLTTGYSIAPDGTFIMVESDPNARPTQIQVVTHWENEVTRLAPPPR